MLCGLQVSSWPPLELPFGADRTARALVVLGRAGRRGKLLCGCLVGVNLPNSALIQAFREERVCARRTLLKLKPSASPFTLLFLFALICSRQETGSLVYYCDR